MKVKHNKSKINLENKGIVLNFDNNYAKYQQVIDAINNAIANNFLKIGDPIPSVNSFSKTYKVSRDTVFKAYSILKKEGVLKSISSKGYFVAGDFKKVLLLLNTFKPYKEVLYDSFIENLPKNYIVDLQFHHYSIENFKNILRNANVKYYKCIVTGMDHKAVPAILSKIDNKKLLSIDLDFNLKPESNFVVQDFGKSFYESLSECSEMIKKYEEFVFIYPHYTNHPKDSITFFKKFCEDFKCKYRIITNPKDFRIEKNKAYISANDRIMSSFLEQCLEHDYQPGIDVGFISYNEIPLKKFIYKGITVISTDFKELGKKAAQFITGGEPMKCYLPAKLILRASL